MRAADRPEGAWPSPGGAARRGKGVLAIAPAAAVRLGLALATVAFACPLIPILRGRGLASGDFAALAGFTVPVTLLLGVPTLWLLLRRGCRAWWQYALGGAAIGALCAFPFAGGGLPLLLFLLPNFIAIGALHGALFWLLGVWRNRGLGPGRDPAA